LKEVAHAAQIVKVRKVRKVRKIRKVIKEKPKYVHLKADISREHVTELAH
jgi:hypothetical protein